MHLTSALKISIFSKGAKMVNHQIRFYSGGSSEETPRELMMNGRCLMIRRILSRQLIGSPVAGGRNQRRFVVELEDGSIWRIREAEEAPSGWVAEIG